jgi:heme/copper-type cytochrome/quinol oxidase subunit 2
MYFFLAVFMGMFLGGVYNSLENSEILSYTKNDPRETDLFSTVNIGLGCFLVGIFQLVIGFVIHLSSNNSEGNTKKPHNHRMIYVVIALLAVIAIALTFLRTYYSKKEKDDFRQVNQDETNKNTF